MSVCLRIALVVSGDANDLPALAVARALRAAGHQATLVEPQESERPERGERAARWLAEGFAWLPVGAARLVPAAEHFPRFPGLAAARALADVVAGFDAVWFFAAHWAQPMLRERRFRERQLPVIVLNSEAPAGAPGSLEEIVRASAAEYAMRWSDGVMSGSAVEDVRALERICAARALEPTAPAGVVGLPQSSPAVTVCMPYYEAAEWLPLTLASLERQSSTDFTVIVVDDGSISEAARRVFAECAERYSARGWRFLRQENASPGAARNHAAREAATEFLLFLDSDDIAMPGMVERFLRAARLTGDDCLVVPNYGFRDDPEGPAAVLYDPPGNHLIASMADDMHGGACIFVRREAFWAVGGFTAERGVGFEDYELHVRFNLAGMRWDVLPELIYRYRMPREGNVSRVTTQYANHAGVLRWYERRLRPVGLGQVPLAFASVYREHEAASARLGELRRTMGWRVAKAHPQGREVKLLLVTCNFPYGIVSGWHTRVREMIRYLGSRYELTLVTAMSREQLAPVRPEAMRYLHAVRGVEGSEISVARGEDLPFRVRQHTTDMMQAALQALPTEGYHAAILDQIFLGELRREIDTTCVLTEHNIESRLLQQAAQREWTAELPEAFANSLAEAGRMERYEDRVWLEFPLRAVVSEVDRAEMQRRAPGGRTVVAANGADPGTWLEDAQFSAQTVLFSGHLAYLPNIDAVDWLLTAIWPEVLRQRPGARLIIAGRDPGEAMRASVARASGVELSVNPVSMNVVAARASVTVAPLRLGSGTRVKILDSLAWGLPLVSTAAGAEGINVVDGEHVLLRDSAQEFAEGVVRLLSDEALWGRLRLAGRQLVGERYSWDRVFAPLDAGLLEIVEG